MRSLSNWPKAKCTGARVAINAPVLPHLDLKRITGTKLKAPTSAACLRVHKMGE
jgi:hypothetical protein